MEKDQLAHLGKTKPRQFWKHVKMQYTKRLPTAENMNISDLNEHFKELYSTETQNVDSDNPNRQYHTDVLDQDLDCIITEDEVRNAVFNQNNTKSSSLDNIVAEFYKHSFEFLSPFIVQLFNRIFINGEYQNCWGHGVVIPIFKGGDIENPKSNRGIILINVLGKIFSQILLNRLTEWSDKYDKITPTQFGFQKCKSTVGCIFILHAIISKTLNDKKKLYCAFIDFEKCFDRIDRSFLFHKLVQQCVSARYVKAVKNMYNIVKSCIKHKEQTSEFFESNIGVKQGDPSSTLLFLYFVNDIASNINVDIDGLFTVNELKLFLFFTYSTARRRRLLSGRHMYMFSRHRKLDFCKIISLISGLECLQKLR